MLVTSRDFGVASDYTGGVVSVSAWEAIFMLLVLKIPIVYLAVVVLWAVRSLPETTTDPGDASVLAPLDPCGWDESKRRRSLARRRRPRRPAGSPFAARVSA